MTIKAIIFDLDDTLISEIDYIKSGFNNISKVLSSKLNLPSSAIYNRLVDLFHVEPGNVFNRLFDELQIPYSDDDILSLVRLYRKHWPTIEFYSDVVPCLMQLSAIGIRTGIITDGYKETQNNKLKALKADQCFEHIIITDDLGREYWKPHPFSFELIRDWLQVDFNEMMYVGDNPEKDFYIGTIYPIVTVRIDRNGIYSNTPYLHDVKEKVQIRTLLELPNMAS